MSAPYLVGYADRFSAQAGQPISVMLSAEPPVRAELDLVRLGRGEVTGEVQEERVLDLGRAELQPQATVVGSCVEVPGANRAWPPGPFTVEVLVMPTRTGRSQALLSQSTDDASWVVGLTPSGAPMAGATWPGGQAEAAGDAPLVCGAWYRVAAEFVPGRSVVIEAKPLEPTASWWTAPTAAVRRSGGTWSGTLGLQGLLRAPIFLAARATPFPGNWTDSLDGKLEAPRIVSEVEWDFAATITDAGVPAERVAALGVSGLDGTCRNSPARAVTGHRWDGTEQDFRRAPDHYAAIHFHADDLDDCRWAPTVTVDLPADLASGAYAVRARAADGRVDRVPFFVRPRTPGRSPLLVLMPTASYLAYANDHPASDGQMAEAVAGKTPVVLEGDLLLHEHREWGMSCYDLHADGSGVAYSTLLRPLLNMRPTHRYHVGAWQLPADLAVLSWLDAQGIGYEVATDEDLQRDGAGLLDPYRVVLTGTHPEYYSTKMLDALEGWVGAGGRLVYIGANGFYWRVAFEPSRPGVMEIRRGHAGSRAWESAPGETHLATTGEQGGMWRHLGRAPQKLTGVGYAAQGFDRSGWYRRLPDSRDARAAFVFDGVGGEVFGRRGSIGGGAVGQELDRYDRALGTPHDALLLATSEGLSEAYLRCVEEITFTVPGVSALLDPQVRADMVYFVNPGGGAVFATGSIAWAGALGVDGDVDRITRNVLDRFCDPAPLDWELSRTGRSRPDIVDERVRPS
ncbi:MAG: hypothetical protein J2P57_10425 [Acidimicrobiaceae bacterium]|nr:hypothetical protein [Acidimicrobiaceae bacterium]